VERDQGYDLNRLLFERLVLKGFPHVTLSVQHPYALTYPESEDAPQTETRENIRVISFLLTTPIQKKTKNGYYHLTGIAK